MAGCDKSDLEWFPLCRKTTLQAIVFQVTICKWPVATGMDLLGSIMSKMEKPPTTSTQAQREAKSKQLEEAKKSKERQKQRILKFKSEVRELIKKFVEDDTLLKKALPPMDEIQRSIVHEVAEVASIVCHAFGVEGVDRYMMLFKKEYEISPDELAALRRGDEYDPVRSKQERFERDLQRRLEEQVSRPTSGRRQVAAPASFLQKRQQLVVGCMDSTPLQPSAVNAQFGVVASHLKTDKRSIEETLADIRAKKLRQAEPDQG